MKSVFLIAVICCLGLTQAVTHDEIKGFIKKAEGVAKCVIDSHEDIDSVEDFIESLESVAADNDKIEELRNAVADFLESVGYEIDDSRGYFGIAVDVFNGVKQTYKEGKGENMTHFIDALLKSMPEGAWDEIDKVGQKFLEDEDLKHCHPDKVGGNKRSALYNILRRFLSKRK